MATQVSFQGVFPCDGSLCFQFSDGGAFSVNSFNDGILAISPVGECTIYSLANNIAGCFEEGSNFNGLKAIEFEFKGVCVSINAENADFKKIIQLWNEKIEEIDISYQKEYAVARMLKKWLKKLYGLNNFSSKMKKHAKRGIIL